MKQRQLPDPVNLAENDINDGISPLAIKEGFVKGQGFVHHCNANVNCLGVA
jgi:hypothetical protein